MGAVFSILIAVTAVFYPYIWLIAYHAGFRLVDNRIGDVVIVMNDQWYPSSNSKNGLIGWIPFFPSNANSPETLVFSKAKFLGIDPDYVSFSKIPQELLNKDANMSKSPYENTVQFPWGKGDFVDATILGKPCCAVVVREHGLFVSTRHMDALHEILDMRMLSSGK